MSGYLTTTWNGDYSVATATQSVQAALTTSLGKAIDGVPMTVEVVDFGSGAVVGSFSLQSGTTCEFESVEDYDTSTEYLAGVTCPFGTITINTTGVFELEAVFAGSPAYVGSVSSAAMIF